MITMLRRVYGSPHGTDAFWYEKGAEYGPDTHPPMTDSLRQTFLDEGWAAEAKDLGAAPENKMLEPAVATKRRGRRKRARD